MANHQINNLSLTPTINYQYFILDQKYKDFSNLTEYVNECQQFYNGDQWNGANDDNEIRVTENIVSYSSNFKASKINGTPQYIQYTANNGKDCTHLERFDEYNLKKLKELFTMHLVLRKTCLIQMVT